VDGAAAFAGIRGIGYRLWAPDQRAQHAVPRNTDSTTDSITDSTTTTDAE
jgi:hypothetical protein